MADLALLIKAINLTAPFTEDTLAEDSTRKLALQIQEAELRFLKLT
jgi:hypothetical protein